VENRKHIARRESPVEVGSALKIVVIHTSTKHTLAAIQAARELAGDLGPGIHVIVPQVVPYPAAYEDPPVSRSFLESKLRTIAQAARIDTKVEIRFARDWNAAATSRLEPHSVVVIAAGKRRWYWPSREHRLAAFLRKLGHQVVLIEGE
jgi:hypothetical protein